MLTYERIQEELCKQRRQSTKQMESGAFDCHTVEPLPWLPAVKKGKEREREKKERKKARYNRQAARSFEARVARVKQLKTRSAIKKKQEREKKKKERENKRARNSRANIRQ